MTERVRVVVVGGGIVGCGVLYGLAKRGWTDTLLVERLDLTSGSTWHAAGKALLQRSSGMVNCARLLERGVGA